MRVAVADAIAATNRRGAEQSHRDVGQHADVSILDWQQSLGGLGIGQQRKHVVSAELEWERWFALLI